MTTVATSASRQAVTLACRQCGVLFTPYRSDARTCSPRCRTARHRSGPPASHQRQVRELLADAAGPTVKIDHPNAKLTHSQVGSELAGWFSFQPMFDWSVDKEPDLLD